MMRELLVVTTASVVALGGLCHPWLTRRAASWLLIAGLLILGALLTAYVCRWPLTRMFEARHVSLRLHDRMVDAGYTPFQFDALPTSDLFARRADTDQSFRHWLVAILKDAGEDHLVRLEAGTALWNLTDAAAQADALREQTDWLKTSSPVDPDDDRVHAATRLNVEGLLLGTALPDREVLEFARELRPADWRRWLQHRADLRVDAALPREVEELYETDSERARRILDGLDEPSRPEAPAEARTETIAPAP